MIYPNYVMTVAILFLLWSIVFRLLLILIKLIKNLRKLKMRKILIRKKIQIRHLLLVFWRHLLLVFLGIRSLLRIFLNKVVNALVLYLILMLSVLTFLFIALTFMSILYLVVLIIRFMYDHFELIYDHFELMNSESRKFIPFLISIVFRLRFIMVTLFEKSIGLKLRTFFQKVLYYKSFWYGLLGVTVSIGTIATIFLLRRIFFVFQKIKNEPKAELNQVEFLIVSLTTFGAILPFVFVLQQIVSYSRYFLRKIFYQMIKNRSGAGLLCGFICTATMGYIPYIFLILRLSLDNFEDSFFFEHHQKRVAAITSFVVAQCLKFLFFYNWTMYQALYKPIYILMIFLGFFVFQVFWTHETIVKNWRYLYARDKRKRVVRRVLFLQFEFVANFFIQLTVTDSQVEKLNSMVRRISLRYILDKVFVRMTFLGWFLGHIVFTIFYMKIFELVRVWVYPYIKNLFDSKGGGGRNENRWDFVL